MKHSSKNHSGGKAFVQPFVQVKTRNLIARAAHCMTGGPASKPRGYRREVKHKARETQE